MSNRLITISAVLTTILAAASAEFINEGQINYHVFQSTTCAGTASNDFSAPLLVSTEEMCTPFPVQPSNQISINYDAKESPQMCGLAPVDVFRCVVSFSKDPTCRSFIQNSTSGPRPGECFVPPPADYGTGPVFIFSSCDTPDDAVPDPDLCQNNPASSGQSPTKANDGIDNIVTEGVIRNDGTDAVPVAPSPPLGTGTASQSGESNTPSAFRRRRLRARQPILN